MENLRPGAFLSSMLIRPADPQTESWCSSTSPTKIIPSTCSIPAQGARWRNPSLVARTVWFDRLDLSIVRQVIFDDDGVAIVSDTHYAKWTSYDGVLFPAHIGLNRRKDGYGVVMDIVDMEMNMALTDEQFVLNQPEGSTLQVIGDPKRETN